MASSALSGRYHGFKYPDGAQWAVGFPSKDIRFRAVPFPQTSISGPCHNPASQLSRSRFRATCDHSSVVNRKGPIGQRVGLEALQPGSQSGAPIPDLFGAIQYECWAWHRRSVSFTFLYPAKRLYTDCHSKSAGGNCVFFPRRDVT